MTTQILLVDDDPLMTQLMAEWLGDGYKFITAASAAEALKLFREHAISLVILDYTLPDGDGGELFKRLRAERDDLPVVFVTGYPNLERAVELMRNGACDYLTKPFSRAELVTRIEQVLKLGDLFTEVAYYRERATAGSADFCLGQSPAMQRLVEQMQNLARHGQATVLLTGATGTGKSLVAKRIHELSCNRGAPFVEIDCSTIPRELCESELFGHEKGAFTGAHRARPGLFELARQGTVLLDEIGELDYPLQAKLLRVLESRVFKRVGGQVPMPMSARVVAATNRNLAEMVQERAFREDLFFRLNVFEVRVPELRERPQDIVPLADYFRRRFRQLYQKANSGFTKEATDFLASYPFPGNVRELKNMVERATINTEADLLPLDALAPPELDSRNGTLALLQTALRPAPARMPGASYLRLVNPQGAGLDPVSSRSLAETERQLLIDALEEAGGNKTRAAHRLGLTRAALSRRLIKHGIVFGNDS